MNTIIFISIFLLAAASFGLYLWNRRPPRKEPDYLPEPQGFDGMFAEQYTEEIKLLEQSEADESLQEERQSLLERATEGDRTTLDEASMFHDTAFYCELLRALSARAEGDIEALNSIVEYIVNSRSLRSSAEFAAMMIERWIEAPESFSFVRMLHLAALGDDETVFKRAVEMAQKLFLEGRLTRVSSEDFFATVESAYWLIDYRALRPGSSLVLKQLIADVRRELAAVSRR